MKQERELQNRRLNHSAKNCSCFGETTFHFLEEIVHEFRKEGYY
jgi:hypothetical protein